MTLWMHLLRYCRFKCSFVQLSLFLRVKRVSKESIYSEGSGLVWSVQCSAGVVSNQQRMVSVDEEVRVDDELLMKDVFVGIMSLDEDCSDGRLFLGRLRS